MSAWSLCTEQDARDIQSMPDTIPETWSEMVEGMIRDYIGQSMLAITAEDFTESRSGDNTTFLRLKNSPIVSVSSLVVSSVAIASSDFYIGGYYVQLTESVFTQGVRNVVITYSAGGGTATPDVRMAAAMMIVAVNNYFGRQGSDASLKWSSMMDETQAVGEDSPSKALGLPAHLRGIMRTMIRQKRFKIA